MSEASRPRLLDLFCGGGAASVGYHRAGFDVVGVDLRPQPGYPYPFVLADAMEVDLSGFDAYHASPPCQGYSKHVSSDGAWDRTSGRDEPRLIAAVRERLQATGKPWVIENVVGARDELRGPALLCGTMFDLPIARHRLFETSWPLGWASVPMHQDCRGVAKAYAEERGWEYRDMSVTGKGRRAGTSERWSEVMGIDWPMSQHQLREAIPPAYAKYIGELLYVRTL